MRSGWNLSESRLAKLRREPDDEIGEANTLGLCQVYLGIDLEVAKSINICGQGLAFDGDVLLS